ncbi:hypothetical protein V5O48_000270 [Marasmius crinis-equi]|uniref:Uncharacterized protein n=1 Tax=Marasmius crinis-equi TaxID=585013 RepID=A0ABR3G1W0_9AGAR
MNDFTKVLAGEVRTLLAEVGKLREEKAQLQSEIGELMQLKSRNGARGIGPGGELAIYSAPPGWGSPPPEQPAASPPPHDPSEPARPAWRTVNKRQPRKKAAPPPPPVPASPAPPPNLPAWAQWRPNPRYSPAIHPGGSPIPGTPPPAARAGLFGPPSPK